MHELYVGIDVHKECHKVAILSASELNRPEDAWRMATILDIRNCIDDFGCLYSVIRDRASSTKEVTIAIDHTGGHYSEPIVFFLQSKGYNLCYLESKAMGVIRDRLFDKESKNDITDAVGAAYLLFLKDAHNASFRVTAVRPELGSEASVLRHIMLQRELYNKLANQMTSRLHQLLLAVFPEGEKHHFRTLLRIATLYPTPQDILANVNLRGIKYVSRKCRDSVVSLAAQTVGVPGDIYREIIKDLCERRIEAIARRDRFTEIAYQKVKSHPYGHVLLSFPGLGATAAATIIAIVRDVDKWPTKKKMKKALGVYSTQRQSGATTSRSRMGREGSTDGRRVLFQVVFNCIRKKAADNDFRDYYLRQLSRNKRKMTAVVATMGKLAEVLYHCLKYGEYYQYQGKCKSAGSRKRDDS